MVRTTAIRPRLEDVAAAAGVHASTASRVLTGAANVRIADGTRERVLAAAAGLNYRPNAIAQGLKLAASYSVGMLVPSLRNPVYAEIIHGAFVRAWERGYVVLLAEDTGEAATIEAYERLVSQRRIDGLLMASARPSSTSQRFMENGAVPVVFVNRRVPGAMTNVSMREEDAGALAAEHLLSLGHRKLGHISGPLELDTARRRADGFVATCRAAGCEPDVASAEFNERGGLAALERLLERGEQPTAIFVSNINQAVGALAGIRRLGIAVPGELSILSYDDDPFVEFLDVPLTTIRMPLHELGEVAVDALIDRLGTNSPEPWEVAVRTAPEMVVRCSTGPCPNAGRTSHAG